MNWQNRIEEAAINLGKSGGMGSVPRREPKVPRREKRPPRNPKKAATANPKTLQFLRQWERELSDSVEYGWEDILYESLLEAGKWKTPGGGTLRVKSQKQVMSPSTKSGWTNISHVVVTSRKGKKTRTQGYTDEGVPATKPHFIRKIKEHQFKERPGWSKKKPKPKNKWAPRGRTKYSKKGEESKKTSRERWSWRDPEGVDPKNPHRTGYEPTIHASGLRNRRTGEPIKKKR
jgi:hypothetical protein